jgi:prepilin-type N-terminal cleavage/methylation domain-containing protein
LKNRMDTGMTLIEVLIAVAILSVGLVMMLTAISRCLGVLKIAEQYHKSMWALSAGEAEFPLFRRPDMKPEDYEVPAKDYDGIRFERLVADPDADSEDNEMRLVVLTTKLSWQGRSREQAEEVVRYVLYHE